MHQKKSDWRGTASATLAGVCFLLHLAGFAAAQPEFPFGEDLRLDKAAMPGTKRVPVLTFDDDGEATIDLWCNTVKAEAVIAGETITIIPGARTERACPPDLMQADDDLIDALQQVTAWRRTANGVTLIGPRTLTFSTPTN